jgi:DNA-binding MarR family transcriptional regulator
VQLQSDDTADVHVSRAAEVAGAELASNLRVALGQLNRRLREQSSMVDLTRSQLNVLVRLEREGPSTMSALARAEGIRPQSMSAIVSVLESAGHISGTPDPADGRKTVLSLTDATRERFETGRLIREDWLSRAIHSQLEPAEQGQLGRLVELLKRLAVSP